MINDNNNKSLAESRLSCYPLTYFLVHHTHRSGHFFHHGLALRSEGKIDLVKVDTMRDYQMNRRKLFFCSWWQLRPTVKRNRLDRCAFLQPRSPDCCIWAELGSLGLRSQATLTRHALYQSLRWSASADICRYDNISNTTYGRKSAMVWILHHGLGLEDSQIFTTM